MVMKKPDVIVIGSGGTGLMAALSAAKHGARVLVLEGYKAWGGTTGFCGGPALGAGKSPHGGQGTSRLAPRISLLI